MSEWHGKVVGYGTVKRHGKDEPVVLILEDSGERLWRFEDELSLANEEEKERELCREKRESAATSQNTC